MSDIRSSRGETPEPRAGETNPEGPVSLEPSSGAARPDSKPLSAALERIGANSPKVGRYRLDGEIARGGMGVIQKVWDANLRRSVARKLLGKGPSGYDSRQSDPRSVGRFLEEAQVTAQLEHPGIVPVHELGLDAEGKLYFTMRLVRGEDLHKIFEHVKTGAAGWNLTRALHVMLRVCEAMSYAHKKGVLHRDLKPANVMVGRFGEVYVMDWGLARVLGEHDTKDVRIAPAPASTEVRTDRASIDVDTPDSPLLTMDGDVVGTPAYMSPEQARGELDALGPASDVYSLGAMLYHLLAGHMPYAEPGTKPSARAIWYRVMEQPPVPLANQVPAELVAIAEKAMAREVARRYATITEVADDLRAFLEHRVVRAYRTGPFVELSKWTTRNRLAAASLAGLLLAILLAGFLSAMSERRRSEVLASASRRQLAAVLVRSVEDLWPIHPDTVPALEQWLARASEALALEDEALILLRNFEASHRIGEAREVQESSALDPRLAFLEFRLSSLRDARDVLLGKDPPSNMSPELVQDELRWRKPNLRAVQLAIEVMELDLAAANEPRPGFAEYSETATRAAYAPLRKHVEDLYSLRAPRGGLVAEVQRRLDLCKRVEAVSLVDSAHLWEGACSAVADPGRCPLYVGVTLQPVLGLVPLWQDPRTGLWQFWHVLSGSKPARGPEDQVIVDEETGLVLILVPGGQFWMGSQDDSTEDPNYFLEPGVHSELGLRDDWLFQAELAPFLLSKFEMTQGQWYRLTGKLPSEYLAGDSRRGMPRFTLLQPLESVSWEEADRVLARHGLGLPTEAQWERAARAGTQQKYSGSSTFTPILPQVNGYDRSFQRAYGESATAPYDDGHVFPAPVGTFAPNAWGFHDLFGNVREWCKDWYASRCEGVRLAGPAQEQIPEYSALRSFRGGSYYSTVDQLWVSARNGQPSDFRTSEYGIRPCAQAMNVPKTD